LGKISENCRGDFFDSHCMYVCLPVCLSVRLSRSGII